MKIGRLLLPMLATTCVLGMASCGNSEGAAQPAGVFEKISARNDAASKGPSFWESPPEAMPQVRYSINGRDPISVADAYVVGDFVAVEPGVSHRWTLDNDTETKHQLEFNAEDAQTSHVHVTLRIKRSLVDPNQPESVRRELSPGNTVTFGLSMGAPVDIAAVRQTFEGQSHAVLLKKPSEVFAYDPSLWAVLVNGAFLGRVSDDGRTVTFPALDEESGQRSTFTVEELERPGGKPIRVTREEDGRYVREGSTPSPAPSAPDQPRGTPGPRDVPAATSPVPEPSP